MLNNNHFNCFTFSLHGARRGKTKTILSRIRIKSTKQTWIDRRAEMKPKPRHRSEFIEFYLDQCLPFHYYYSEYCVCAVAFAPTNKFDFVYNVWNIHLSSEWAMRAHTTYALIVCCTYIYWKTRMDAMTYVDRDKPMPNAQQLTALICIEM